MGRGGENLSTLLFFLLATLEKETGQKQNARSLGTILCSPLTKYLKSEAPISPGEIGSAGHRAEMNGLKEQQRPKNFLCRETPNLGQSPPVHFISQKVRTAACQGNALLHYLEKLQF